MDVPAARNNLDGACVATDPQISSLVPPAMRMSVASELEAKGWRTLDDVKRCKLLAAIFGLATSEALPLCRELLRHGFVSGEMPDCAQVTSNRNISRYLRPDIVGAELYEKNRRFAITKKLAEIGWTNLDSVRKEQDTLARLLGVADSEISVANVARALLAQKFMSAEWPDGHPLGQPGRVPLFLNPDIVGCEQASANKSAAIRSEIKRLKWESLDDILPSRETLAKLVGATFEAGRSRYYKVTELARA